VKSKTFAGLILLTIVALFVHGYHPYAEDAEIYVPGIVTILHPTYYPFGREFFETHARFTFYPNLIAWTSRLGHLSLAWALFLWYLASVFLILYACWRIAAKCFPTPMGQWGAVGLVAALLTLPVAGTSLYIFDEYLNPRSFSAFAVIFAIDAGLEKKYGRMVLWLICTTAIQPFMTVFGVAFLLILFAMRARPSCSGVVAAFGPLLIFKEPSAAFWACLRDHRYYYLLRWTWYEWLGIIGPLLMLWWFSRIARKKQRPTLELLTLSLFLFNANFFAAGLIVTIPKALEILTPYQPMRSLQLVYLLWVLFCGGLLGEYFLKKRAALWLAIFVPLCAGMCYAQLQLFPTDRHVEWPGASPKNAWAQAFLWIRTNTPTNAIFALDPDFIVIPGEDNQGFRAAAERSRMADADKDWSAAVLFPELPFADHVQEQVLALQGWRNFGAPDFERLKRTYGVTWVVLEQQQDPLPDCPYENRAVRVCRVQ
jgi:hypothetical protein